MLVLVTRLPLAGCGSLGMTLAFAAFHRRQANTYIHISTSYCAIKYNCYMPLCVGTGKESIRKRGCKAEI